MDATATPMPPDEPDAAQPATAPDPASRESYRPELDGIRAFCIVFTIFNHIDRPFFINGTVGVDVFFALSGWLITTLLIREHQERRTVRLAAFYIRRVFRIMPLYFLAFGLSAVLILAAARARIPELRGIVWYALSFCMEYRPEKYTLFGQAWSLGIEEKFYLAWPLILAATMRRPAVTAQAALGSIALLFWAFGTSGYIWRGYCDLGFGAGLAMIVLRRDGLKSWLARHALADRLMPVMLAPYIASLLWPDQAIWNIALAFLGAPIIASLWFRKDQAVGRFLAFGPFPWLGRLTYAIYLLQAIGIRAAEFAVHAIHQSEQNPYLMFAVAYPISVLMAWAAHVWVEKPLIAVGKALAATRRQVLV